ncbi:MAG: DUF502 domain-containing protein [Hyphomicrobiaceae bacterium]|nr:DUF502 domain-containing protein [Hyphomicrobiaceae bacterium]
MRSILGTIWRTGIVGNLLAGLIALLPLVLTVVIISWIVGVVAASLGPGTWFGDLLISSGAAIIGPKRELIAFVVGAGLALAGLWFLGLVVRVQARRALEETFDGVFGRVPLFRAIYRPVSQVVRMFAGSNADLAAMSVVMCRLGGQQGVDVPALLASHQVFDVAGERRLLVYLPTSPLPAWEALCWSRNAASIRCRAWTPMS